MNHIEEAVRLALRAHEGQMDKAGNPYILHPIKVAANQETLDGVVVALLHDAVEDSNLTIDELNEIFPEHITEAIELLTHKQGVTYFDYIQEISRNELAKAVKIQDLLHNSDLTRLKEITDQDHARVEKYKKALEMLQEA